MDEEIERDILEYITENRGVTFAELMNTFDIDGECVIYSGPMKDKIVLWDGVSEEFAEFITRMIYIKKIKASSEYKITKAAYYIDGRSLTLPIAMLYKFNYNSPHWLPVLLDPMEVTA